MQNQKSAIGLEGNLTALIGYIVGIIALVEIFIEKDNRFARFHAIQSVAFHVLAWIVLTIAWVATVVISLILSQISSVLGILSMLLWLICLVLFFAYLGGLIYVAIKAYQGNMVKLPIVGNLAEKWT
jgi:uncharacterized membrane protein